MALIPIINGCTDLTSPLYNSIANTDDGSCNDVVYGCIYNFFFVTNYNPLATINEVSAQDSSDPCIYDFGRRMSNEVCIDTLANNYVPQSDPNSDLYNELVA